MAYRVGIAGATGLVGQRLVARLARHPWFHLHVVGASERSAGRRYREAATWLLSEPMPDDAGDLLVGACTPGSFSGCDLVLSALDAATGREVEPALAAAGIAVVSNSSAMRLDPDVPLLVPEINASHVEVLKRRAGDRRGFVVTNPNCSVTGLAMALAPLHRAFGVRRVVVATMQAVSGAGLTGPRSIELLDNVLPYIAGEEEKIEIELGKILGGADERGFAPAEIAELKKAGVVGAAKAER
jgi:aspartate-semialdehyde dehydrogenase